MALQADSPGFESCFVSHWGCDLGRLLLPLCPQLQKRVVWSLPSKVAVRSQQVSCVQGMRILCRPSTLGPQPGK